MTQAPPAGYGQPHAGPAKNSGLGVAALIVGILALILSPIPCVNVLGIILAVVGLGLGIAGWVSASGKPETKATLAIVGTVLSILAVIVFIISYVLLSAFGGSMIEAGARMGVRADADRLAVEAREAGVEQSVIDDARNELDSAVDGFKISFSDEAAMEESARKLQSALDAYYEKLQEAAGPDNQLNRPNFEIEGTRSGSGVSFEYNEDGDAPAADVDAAE